MQALAEELSERLAASDLQQQAEASSSHCSAQPQQAGASAAWNSLVLLHGKEAAAPPILSELLERCTHSERPALPFRLSTTASADAPALAAVDGNGPWISVVVVTHDVDWKAHGHRSRSQCKSAFLVLWHPVASEDPVMRIAAFECGFNMVTHHLDDLEAVLQRIAAFSATGSHTCTWCGLRGLTAGELWVHAPLWHVYDENITATCPCCHEEADNLAVHVHEAHYPGGPQYEQRRPLGAAVVVHRKRDNKFLMVRELGGSIPTCWGGLQAGVLCALDVLPRSDMTCRHAPILA